ncbi:ribonucleotide-diphosphate reductase subunit alpha [compost metagenome]
MADGRAGAFLIINEALKKVLEHYGKDTEEVRKSIQQNDGSVQHLDFLTDHEKLVFKTSKETDPMWIIEQAAARTPYVCQSTSLNIKVPQDVTKEKMSDISMEAWFRGVKSLYYCRAEGTSKAEVGTGGDRPLNAVPVKKLVELETCLACEG